MRGRESERERWRERERERERERGGGGDKKHTVWRSAGVICCCLPFPFPSISFLLKLNHHPSRSGFILLCQTQMLNTLHLIIPPPLLSLPPLLPLPPPSHHYSPTHISVFLSSCIFFPVSCLPLSPPPFSLSLCLALPLSLSSLPREASWWAGSSTWRWTSSSRRRRASAAWWSLLSHCQVTCQAEIWSMFTAVLRKSVRNLQTSTEVGLIQQVLLKMSTVDDMIAGERGGGGGGGCVCVCVCVCVCKVWV